MDIKARKLQFIQEFLKIQNEELIIRLEKVLKNDSKDLNPFTLEEFNARINQSLEDSKRDNVIESDELIEEIKQWH